MASRAARRSKGRQVAVKAPAPAQTGGTFDAAQVAALLMAGQRQQQGAAVPMPIPPSWATDPFGPGRPLPPAAINTPRPDTGRAEPRLTEFPVSTNLQIDPRIHVPWRILQEAADIFLIRECIESRKAVCQLDYAVIVDPGAVAREAAATGSAKKDIESALRDKYKAQISAATDWLACPDPQNNLDWPKWSSLLLDNSLTFDAGVIYPQYNYGGQCLAWRIIDSKTIKPLLDEDGAIPMPPWPAYQQILYGFPRSEFTADPDRDANGKIVYGKDGRPKVSGFSSDTLMYERRVVRSKTPYGMSDVEIALLSVMLWMRRFGWMMGEYDQSSMPATLVETDNAIAWDVTQWEAWLHALNDQLAGSTAERLKLRLMPPGTHVVQAAGIPEQYRPDYDLFLVKLVCGALKTPASEIGFTETGALGASFHEGDEDILYRRARIPDAQWLSGIATRLAQRHIGMPSALKVTILGLESEDEAAQEAVALSQVQSGRKTLNQDNADRGLPPFDFAEADMPMLMTARGVVFLEGASTAAPPGTLIGPAMAAPTDAPPGGDPNAPPGSPVDADADDNDDDAAPPEPAVKPAVKPTAKAEALAYRSWARKGSRGRSFECVTLTKASAPADMAADPRVIFKAGGVVPKDQGPSADRSPSVPGDDVADGVPVNAVLTRERPDTLTGRVAAADGTHHVVGELDRPADRAGASRSPAANVLAPRPDGGSVRRPANGSHQGLGAAEVGARPQLPGLVDRVGLVAAQEQVLGPDAGRVIAGVADVQPGGDRTVGELPGDPVRASGGALGAAEVAASKAEDPVVPVVGVAGSHPLPAVAGLVDLGPESVGVDKGKSHQVSIPKAWPGWDRDEALVNLYAGKIREALTGAIDTGKLAEAWGLLHPGALTSKSLLSSGLQKDVDPALSAFLARAAQALRAALSAILRKLWPEGWVLGQQAAQAAVTGDPVDWAGWTPADYAAAEQIAGDGLQRLLADADITIKSIAASRVSELADVLEATLASDVTHVPPLPEPLPPVNSVGSLAKALTAVLDDPGRARMVAHTEIARAQSAAALDQYRSLDVGTKGWLTAEDAKVCPQCDADEAAGDIPLGDRFPSGNDAPPGHPICRCALMPGLARAA